jgi:hypothetical protein
MYWLPQGRRLDLKHQSLSDLDLRDALPLLSLQMKRVGRLLLVLLAIATVAVSSARGVANEDDTGDDAQEKGSYSSGGNLSDGSELDNPGGTAAELVNGNDDIDPAGAHIHVYDTHGCGLKFMSDLVCHAGNCVVETQKFCDHVEPGAARLADCVQEQVAAEESGTTSADEGVTPGCWCSPRYRVVGLTCLCIAGTVSSSCKAALLDFKALRASNINLNTNLGTRGAVAHWRGGLNLTRNAHLQPRAAIWMPTSTATTRAQLATSLGKCWPVSGAQHLLTRSRGAVKKVIAETLLQGSSYIAPVQSGWSGLTILPHGCCRQCKQNLTGPCKEEVFKMQLDVRNTINTTFASIVTIAGGWSCSGVPETRLRLPDNFHVLHWDCVAHGWRPHCCAQAALDYRADVSLFQACREDALKQCAGVEPGGGRIQTCLVRAAIWVWCCSATAAWLQILQKPWQRLELVTAGPFAGHPDTLKAHHQSTIIKMQGGRLIYLRPACAVVQREKRMELSSACADELMRQEIENTDDIRLSVQMFRKCLGDKKKVRYS